MLLDFAPRKSALNRFSSTPRAITHIGRCATNGSNTFPSDIVIFVPPCKKLHLLQGGSKLLQNINSLEGLASKASAVIPDALGPVCICSLIGINSIKLASVATDVMGVSGRAILRALLAGVANPEELA